MSTNNKGVQNVSKPKTRKRQEKTIQFCITIFESRGLEIRYPSLLGQDRVSITEIEWQAVDKMANPLGRIRLTKWDKKYKLIIYLSKNSDEGMSAIDPYVLLSENKTHLILPYGRGQISLGKISPDMFMSLQEMRDYLGY